MSNDLALSPGVCPTGRKYWQRIPYLVAMLILSGLLCCVVYYALQGSSSSEYMQYQTDPGQTPVPLSATYNPFAIVQTADETPEPLDWREILENIPVSESPLTQQPGEDVSQRHILTSLERDITDQTILQKNRVKHIFQDLFSIQQIIQRHYIQHRAWLQSKSDFGTQFIYSEFDYIDEIHSPSEGEILVLLDRQSGKQKRIRLTPDIHQSGHIVRWHCQTNIANELLGRGENRVCIYNPYLNAYAQ